MEMRDISCLFYKEKVICNNRAIHSFVFYSLINKLTFEPIFKNAEFGEFFSIVEHEADSSEATNTDRKENVEGKSEVTLIEWTQSFID